jgi:hypothetical protein
MVVSIRKTQQLHLFLTALNKITEADNRYSYNYTSGKAQIYGFIETHVISHENTPKYYAR